jgi:heat-inducible transcriptional repressor
MGSADDRRFEVLRAIVADFVATKEPIGSKALVERHNLGVSSATVRNDMAVLEAEGYIAQPHTSSGRVPTEKGYREFVNRIDDVKPLSTSERRAILQFLDSGVDLDDVLRRAVRLLAQLTRQVAIVQYPTLSTSTVRHLEVVALTPARLLMVVITDSGRVDQRIVELGDTIDDHQLAQLRELLGQALEGKRLAAASVAVSDLAAQLDGSGGFSDAVGRSATVLLESLVEHSEERLLMGGTANLTRNTADFGGSLRSVLEALEEQVVVLRLLAAQQEAGKVTVRIGHETEAEQMAGTSVVTTTYGSSGTVFGGMGVVGPTRMDYPGTIATSPPLRCTSAKFLAADEAADAEGWRGTRLRGTRIACGVSRAQAIRRSSAPIGNWPASCIPTSTPTKRPSTSSRRSAPPTRCCPTREAPHRRPRR